MQELQSIIRENSSIQALKMYLGLIAEGTRNSDVNGKELHVLLIGCIAKEYQTQIFNTIDKPETFWKMAIKMCEITRKYLTVISIIAM